jgi:hypothetical protein
MIANNSQQIHNSRQYGHSFLTASFKKKTFPHSYGISESQDTLPLDSQSLTAASISSAGVSALNTTMTLLLEALAPDGAVEGIVEGALPGALASE